MLIIIIILIMNQQILKPADKKKFPYTGIQGARPVTPPKAAQPKGKGKM